MKELQKLNIEMESIKDQKKFLEAREKEDELVAGLRRIAADREIEKANLKRQQEAKRD